MRSRRLGVSFIMVVAGLSACSADRESGGGTPPPPTDSEVVEAVDRFFTAMFERDTTALRSLLLPGAQLVAVESTGTRVSSAESFIAAVSSAGAPLLERMWDPEVRVRGPIATLWTRYDFHRGDTFSHCGTDAFQLATVGGRWRIASIVYTVEREGCAESPLGPPPSGG